MKLLFVCLGNICRSPLAEGMMRHKLKLAGLDKKILVDSTGFEPFHQGDHPDSRAIRAGKEHGFDISSHKARLFNGSDFDEFDHIYVMDHNNYLDVMSMSQMEADKAKVDFLMNSTDPGSNAAVPDPWYGSYQDFEHTCEMLERATDKLLENLIKSQ